MRTRIGGGRVVERHNEERSREKGLPDEKKNFLSYRYLYFYIFEEIKL